VNRNLHGYEIVLGVTGGIAAYKAAALCSLLVRNDAKMTVVMTANAQRFVAPLTFGTLSGRQVHSNPFAAEKLHDLQHITVSRRADLVVVAPATANVIGKLAGGICDDLLSTLLNASDCADVLLAPAMNSAMWSHPATVRNVQTLRQWGCHFVGPESGRLACAEQGLGRMSEPETIVAAVVKLLADRKPKSCIS